MVALLDCLPGMRCSINHRTVLQVGGSLTWPPTAIAASSRLLAGKCHTGSLPLLFQCCLVPTAQLGSGILHRPPWPTEQSLLTLPVGPAPLSPARSSGLPGTCPWSITIWVRGLTEPTQSSTPHSEILSVPSPTVCQGNSGISTSFNMGLCSFHTLRRHLSSTHLSISLGSCQGLKSCILKECSQTDRRCLV